MRTSGTLVRAEELGIVLVVLSLWAAAIALFINRWGKIRLMEPYHPYIETQDTPPLNANAQLPRTSVSHQVINCPFHQYVHSLVCVLQGRNSLLIPGVSCERRPSLLSVLEQHARRQSTLSLLSADYGLLGNSSRRLSASSRVLLQGKCQQRAPFYGQTREA